MQHGGFEEIPHTADWSMRVWAHDLPALFAESAHGMNALSGVQLGSGARAVRNFEHEALDQESLLVAFLSELIYYQENEKLAFDKFSIQVDDSRLTARMEGAPLASIEKPIKAATFNDLKISRTTRGYEVELVFDV